MLWPPRRDITSFDETFVLIDCEKEVIDQYSSSVIVSVCHHQFYGRAP